MQPHLTELLAGAHRADLLAEAAGDRRSSELAGRLRRYVHRARETEQPQLRRAGRRAR